jgi:transposase
MGHSNRELTPFRARTGSPWRDLPPQYGNWKTIYNRQQRWSCDGTWAAVLDELRRGADLLEGTQWTVSVDSTVVRAHQHGVGARRAPAVVSHTGGAVDELDSRR